jgi:hypothetical protein
MTFPVKRPALYIHEISWAPGHYQWVCMDCRSVGNVTQEMVGIPSERWHICNANKSDA